MPEIKSVHTREDIANYARENQLDVANQTQIAAKFLELETRIEEVEKEL